MMRASSPVSGSPSKRGPRRRTILSRGAGQPELQIFIGVNTQFVRK